MPIKTTQADIRKIANSAALKEAIRDDPAIIRRPLMERIGRLIPKRKVIKHWYRQPPRWLLLKGRSTT